MVGFLKRRRNSSKRSILRLDYTSNELTESDVNRLLSLYSNYHYLSTCYEWYYSRLKKQDLALNVTSKALSLLGGSMTPIGGYAVLSVTAVGILIQYYREKSQICETLSQARYAMASYKKILVLIKNVLRGGDFHEDKLLLETSIIDNVVAEGELKIPSDIRSEYIRIYKSSKVINKLAKTNGLDLELGKINHGNEVEKKIGSQGEAIELRSLNANSENTLERKFKTKKKKRKDKTCDTNTNESQEIHDIIETNTNESQETHDIIESQETVTNTNESQETVTNTNTNTNESQEIHYIIDTNTQDQCVTHRQRNSLSKSVETLITDTSIPSVSKRMCAPRGSMFLSSSLDIPNLTSVISTSIDDIKGMYSSHTLDINLTTLIDNNERHLAKKYSNSIG